MLPPLPRAGAEARLHTARVPEKSLSWLGYVAAQSILSLKASSREIVPPSEGLLQGMQDPPEVADGMWPLGVPRLSARRWTCDLVGFLQAFPNEFGGTPQRPLACPEGPRVFCGAS